MMKIFRRGLRERSPLAVLTEIPAGLGSCGEEDSCWEPLPVEVADWMGMAPFVADQARSA